ncbi:MAG: hypothetical protein EP332_06360 [Bacteroidetes bacterium]|nr:MAG: hypothetical protein EP332_06360 [Bacteroidota bacterium]
MNRGEVYDAKTGEALIGATILLTLKDGTPVKNSAGFVVGTITDVNGNYTLASATEGSFIKASYVGYNSMIQEWDNELGFALTERTQGIDEVVIVAKKPSKNNGLKLLGLVLATIGIKKLLSGGSNG